MRNLAMTTAALAVLTFGLYGALVPTHAQEDEPSPQELAEAAVELRQGLFRLLRHNLLPVAGMARGVAPFDADLAERNARRIAALAPMIPELFEQDTREHETETTALAAIWDSQEDFQAKAQALVDNATAFAEAAASGDSGVALGAFGAMGRTCGDCHDSYRAEH